VGLQHLLDQSLIPLGQRNRLRAHIYGVELEIEARPFGGLQIDASAGYQHFTLTQLNQGVNVLTQV
jgi:outer membrane receptor protein involved in Fe transport